MGFLSYRCEHDHGHRRPRTPPLAIARSLLLPRRARRLRRSRPVPPARTSPAGRPGVLEGTVTYSGPLPCTEDQHVVGAAVLLGLRRAPAAAARGPRHHRGEPRRPSAATRSSPASRDRLTFNERRLALVPGPPARRGHGERPLERSGRSTAASTRSAASTISTATSTRSFSIAKRADEGRHRRRRHRQRRRRAPGQGARVPPHPARRARPDERPVQRPARGLEHRRRLGDAGPAAPHRPAHLLPVEGRLPQLQVQRQRGRAEDAGCFGPDRHPPSRRTSSSRSSARPCPRRPSTRWSA